MTQFKRGGINPGHVPDTLKQIAGFHSSFAVRFWHFEDGHGTLPPRLINNTPLKETIMAEQYIKLRLLHFDNPELVIDPLPTLFDYSRTIWPQNNDANGNSSAVNVSISSSMVGQCQPFGLWRVRSRDWMCLHDSSFRFETYLDIAHFVSSRDRVYLVNFHPITGWVLVSCHSQKALK